VLATKHHIEFDHIPYSEIIMVVTNENTGETCEYDLEYKIPCVLDQYIYVDIATELGLEVVKTIGVSLDYLFPDLDEDSATVDAFGFIKIYVTMDGDYIIDTSSLKSKTHVVLSVNTTGA